MSDRHLDWEGCFNVRDLGGLPAAGGRRTRWGAVVRADAVDRLSAAGWSALVGHGVRTVIDLRNEDERERDAAPRPEEIVTLNLPLDGVEDTEFWDAWASGAQFATPLYYRAHLDHLPERSARVIAAIARARPGGVLFHCVGGRDRTGQIAMLLLALAGVEPEEIAADNGLSTERQRRHYAEVGEQDQGPEIEEFLRREGTSAREVILSTLASVDVEARLREGGLRDEDTAALRARLV